MNLTTREIDLIPIFNPMIANKSLNRLEAFSDGVFAIAITLLILEIKFPHAEAGVSLWSRILALWPSFFAFALSFFVILVTWITHHDLVGLIRESSRPIQLANGLTLIYVTFIPFVTEVLADHLTGPEVNTAVAFYCATFVFGSAAFNILVQVIISELNDKSFSVCFIVKSRETFRIQRNKNIRHNSSAAIHDFASRSCEFQRVGEVHTV